MPEQRGKLTGAPNLHPESHELSHPRCSQMLCSQCDPTSRTTQSCRSRVHGACGGATHPKPSGFRPRRVFLRHTCRVGSLPSKSSILEGERRRAAVVCTPAGRAGGRRQHRLDRWMRCSRLAIRRPRYDQTPARPATVTRHAIAPRLDTANLKSDREAPGATATDERRLPASASPDLGRRRPRLVTAGIVIAAGVVATPRGTKQEG